MEYTLVFHSNNGYANAHQCCLIVAFLSTTGGEAVTSQGLQLVWQGCTMNVVVLWDRLKPCSVQGVQFSPVCNCELLFALFSIQLYCAWGNTRNSPIRPCMYGATASSGPWPPFRLSLQLFLHPCISVICSAFCLSRTRSEYEGFSTCIFTG
jgi:hypothetical protein